MAMRPRSGNAWSGGQRNELRRQRTRKRLDNSTTGDSPIPTQLIENRTPIDCAILVGAPTKEVSQQTLEEHLEELVRLTQTAGGEVSSILRQRIDKPNPRFRIGKGKAQELKRRLEEHEYLTRVSVERKVASIEA